MRKGCPVSDAPVKDKGSRSVKGNFFRVLYCARQISFG